MLNATKIKELKDKIDLVNLFKEYGYTPTKKGQSYVTICPFHKDTKPSLSINKRAKLWQCFGCGAAGDAISLVQKIDNISFLKAAKKLAVKEKINLTDLTLLNKPAAKSQKQEQKSISNQELMNQVADYYHQTFLNNEKASKYLKSRGINNHNIFTQYQIGFSDGTLLNHFSSYKSQLIELGILLENHKERFLNCVVFPILNNDDDCISFYGRHIEMKDGGHFYLPGPRSGVFNSKQLKEQLKEKSTAQHKTSTIIITESIIDSLSFINNEIVNVMPIYGTNGFTKDHLELLQELKPYEVLIALDGDEQGQKASNDLINRLSGAYFNCLNVLFPDNQDANEYFQKHSRSDFEDLMQCQTNQDKVLSQESNLRSQNATLKPTLIDKYQIKYAEQKQGKLTVTIKSENLDTKRFLLDTFNLYSNRQRQNLIEEIAKLYSQDKKQVEQEVTELIGIAEQKANQLKGSAASPDNEGSAAAPVKLTKQEEKEAITFLKSPNLLDQIVKDYESVGYIGEEINKKIAYLVMTSRKMKSPLSLVIMSNSAAGKSSLQKATLEFCPEDDCKHFTRLTQQSLYYLGEESIKHKFLSIEEEEGSAEASYSLKTLLSAKELNVVSTGQDPITGKKRADIYKTEGPVAVMVSTTNPELETEFASRTLIISVDESTTQTKNIQAKQRYARTYQGRTQYLKKEKLINTHRNAQTLLDNDLVVVNNYAPQLEFPINRLRYRRSNDHYLDLIHTIAYLRQYQKQIKSDPQLPKYVEVDIEDIDQANNIFKQIMGCTINELKPATIDVLLNIKGLCEKQDSNIFQRRALREYAHYSNAHLTRHLKLLDELEYIRTVNGSNGTKYTYELIYNGTGELEEKFVLGLKNVDMLQCPDEASK